GPEPLAAYERVDRIPVSLTEASEGVTRRRALALRGGEHDGPACGTETSGHQGASPDCILHIPGPVEGQESREPTSERHQSLIAPLEAVHRRSCYGHCSPSDLARNTAICPRVRGWSGQ